MKKFLLSLMAVLVCAYTVQAHDNGLMVAVQLSDWQNFPNPHVDPIKYVVSP